MSWKKHPLRGVWQGMRDRCTQPSHNGFVRYGGRGIRVCERWDSFETFLADMGPRPNGFQLDRFPDVNGNYEPGNCRWASIKQQTLNKRFVVIHVIDGISDTLAGHAKRKGFDPDVIYHRVKKMGFAVEVALSIPATRSGPRLKATE